MSRPRILLVYPYIEDFAAYDHFAKPLGLWMLMDMLHEKADVAYLNILQRNLPELGLKSKADGTGHFYEQVIPVPESLSDIPRRWKRYGIPESLLYRRLKNLAWKPDWIFVSSGMTYWYTGLAYTIRLLREVFPEARIVLGGIYASLLAEHAALQGADYVIPFQQPRKVASGLSELLGISVSAEGSIPCYTDVEEYAYAPLLLSLGCVFRCEYCASPRLLSFEALDISRTIRAFDWLYEEKGVRHFAFYDDALLFRWEKRLKILLEHVLQKGYAPVFHTPNGLHIRFLTEDMASLMKLAGFEDIRLSLESSEEEFHLTHTQKAKREEFFQAMEVLSRVGFSQRHIRVYTLVNVPGQSLSSVEKTMQCIFDAGALPMLAYYSPIPGTPDFERASMLTDLSDPLFHNNTVYLYRSGIDVSYVQYLHQIEVGYRHSVEKM
ncbi:MAG: radical SAM protein [Brevinematales bacterium]|nr:radical SAM protein [Brevinematales bacterium]